MTVWIDQSKNPDRPVPHMDGKVVMKVLRMPMGIKHKDWSKGA